MADVLLLTKFSIKVFDKKMACEECGVVQSPKYNFYMIKCCGETESRFCSSCNWKSIPCQKCKDNKVGDIIITKKRIYNFLLEEELKKNCKLTKF